MFGYKSRNKDYPANGNKVTEEGKYVGKKNRISGRQ
jgi:hypothetical protein